MPLVGFVNVEDGGVFKLCLLANYTGYVGIQRVVVGAALEGW